MQRSDSAQSNTLHALRVTFKSIQSYGDTEKSSNSIGDANGLLGGVYRGTPVRNIARSAWSAAVLALPSKVEQAAGELYRQGSVDDNYVLKDRLGAGACSEVRLAERRDDASRVAVKIVSKNASDLFCPLNGDCREVVAFRTLGTSDHIVKCHEIYEDDRFIYIVMELLTGGPILPRVADAAYYYPRYCENDVVTLVRALVRALLRLHSLGIAHRDVKPDNVLYVSDNKDPTVKLTDFGISHPHSDEQQANDMVGTLLYVAPEVLLRQPYGCAADMWSLGVIVHILLTGYPPFDDDNLLQLVQKVKTDTARFGSREWRVVSPSARDFVSKLLQRDVEKRLSAKQALAHPWITAPRPPPFPAPPMPRKVQQQFVANPPPRQEGTAPLDTAQVNLQEFVRRKEFKRRESVHSDCNLKLSMLVSLSEKSLKISESANMLDAPPEMDVGNTVQDARMDKPVDVSVLAANREEPLSAITSDQRSKSPKKKKKKKKREKNSRVSETSGASSGRPGRTSHPEETSTMSREDTELDNQQDHQLEQERLKQRRLRMQAELRKKRFRGRKSEETSGETASVHSETLSSRSSSSQHDEQDRDPLMLTNSGFSDDNDSMQLHTAFQSRRDADAEDDMDTIQKQRGEVENVHKRGALLGRRSRQSSNTKQNVKAEKTKASRGKGVRVLRRQKQSVRLIGGNKISDN